MPPRRSPSRSSSSLKASDMDVDAAALCGAEIALHAYIYAIEALAGNDCRFTTPAP